MNVMQIRRQLQQNAFNNIETLELIYCYCFDCLFAGYLKPRNTTVYFDTTWDKS